LPAVHVHPGIQTVCAIRAAQDERPGLERHIDRVAGVAGHGHRRATEGLADLTVDAAVDVRATLIPGPAAPTALAGLSRRTVGIIGTRGIGPAADPRHAAPSTAIGIGF